MTDDMPCTGRDDLIPLIPGFLVRRVDDDRLEAHRLYELDDLQREYGCREVLCASCMAELELLCCAERVKEGIVRAALRMVQDTTPWRESNGR